MIQNSIYQIVKKYTTKIIQTTHKLLNHMFQNSLLKHYKCFTLKYYWHIFSDKDNETNF